MKKHVTKPPLQYSTYIDCSECLRKELESKIDLLYYKNTFLRYATKYAGFGGTDELAEFLCACVFSGANYMPGKSTHDLSQGVKTWFSMYDDDRVSVMEKFRNYYYRLLPQVELSAMTLVFCQLLIHELLSILSAPQWQLLNHHNHSN